MPSTVAETEPVSTATSSLNTARTADGGVVRLHRIPEFPTKEGKRQWQLQQMAGAFRVFAKLGFADGGSGHISLRGEPQWRGGTDVLGFLGQQKKC